MENYTFSTYIFIKNIHRFHKSQKKSKGKGRGVQGAVPGGKVDFLPGGGNNRDLEQLHAHLCAQVAPPVSVGAVIPRWRELVAAASETVAAK